MVERQILTALLLRREVSLEQIWQAFLSAEQEPDSSLQLDEFLQLLVKTGTLSPDLVASLGQNPDQSTLCLLQGDTPPAAPALEEPPPARGAAPPGILFARRYEFRRVLGQGANGKVFQARDRMLKRDVAVKIIENPNEAERKRFLQEASAQARVSHENVCRVFDAGEIEGRLFISMQLIQGETLKVASERLSLRDKVRLILQTAEGIHAAHRMGLVHRDIKPGNIMVEQAGEAPRAYVVDFGLVRKVTDPGATGEVAGTPLYMSPEQIQGRNDLVDWRSDVYALGMTLHEILTGENFFAAPTPVSVLIRILQEEPRFSREAARSVPRDLQAIALKCVAKRPGDRYPTMREVADDLRRYLDGQPVSARPVPLPVRLFRWARRNRPLAAAILIGLASAGVLGSLWLASVLESRQRAALSLRFGELVSSIEQIHETSMLLPLHDIGRENRAIRERMDRIRGEMNQIGKIAEGPGHYALGRGFMALENWPEARLHLEAAVREDPGDDAAQLALGQALGMLYRLSRVEIYSLTSAAEREFRLRQCRQELGEPALRHLRAGLPAAGDAREYGEALVAYCEGKYDDAIRLAGNAWQERPAFYPAGILHGLGYVDRGAERIQRAALAEAEADLLRAGEVFAQLLEIARSQPELRRLEAVRRVNLLRIDRKRDALTDDRTDWAFQACTDLLRVDPQSDQARYLQALLHEMAAEIARSRGQDPAPRMDAALSEIRQALKIRPDSPNYWNWLGIFLKTAAEYKLGQGIIDQEMIGQSLDASRRALQLRPNNPKAYNCIGATCRLKAFAAMLEGGDQRPPLREAVTALEEAHRLNPDYPDPYLNLALIYQDLTLYELNYGLDPRDSARQAMSWCEQAIRRAPQNAYLTVVRSGILLALAMFELNTGGDGQAIHRNLTAAQAAVEANPRNAHAHMQLSQANQLLARWRMRRGEDPAAVIRTAEAAGERTVALDAGNPYGYHSLAGAWLAEAEWAVRQGKDPGRSLAEAERFARRCVRMIPADIEMTLLLAQVTRWQAEAALAGGRDPGGPARQGLALLDAAAGMDPREARVPALQAEIRLILARAGSDPEKVRSEAGQAAALFQEALRFNPYLRLELAPSLERALSLRQPAPSAQSRPPVEE